MGIDKAAAVKKLMDGKRAGGTHPEHRAEGIGAGAQMGNRAQIFHRMALFLERVIRRGRALDLNRLRVQLTGLLGLRRQQKLTGHTKRRADILPAKLIVICELRLFRHNLQIAQTAPVVELHKAQTLGFAQSAHPAAYPDRLSGKSLGVGIDRRDFRSFHPVSSRPGAAVLPPGCIFSVYCPL